MTSQESAGAFSFVLHSHLPYCRLAGRWPHGEEWIHEALAETYVPLLDALYNLREEGIDYRLTVSLTPVLTEQLDDDGVKGRFVHYLHEKVEAAEQDVERFGQQGQEHLESLAAYYQAFYRGVEQSFCQRFGKDVVGAFKRLQDKGYVEMITSAATHGYLPLLSRDSSIYAQLRTGIATYERHFDRRPRAIWLPECAYRPTYLDQNNVVRPGLEAFLASLGLTCFFAETHAVEGGRPVGRAAGDVGIGPYAAIKRRYVPRQGEEREVTEGTTLRAYYVADAKGLTEPPVAVIGRNERVGQQVWSGDFGYPGDADYREFHKKDERSGLQYWRVTSAEAGLGEKDFYHPDWAAYRVREHAAHFCGLVEDLLRAHHAEQGHYGIVSANYDSELFGHWWFEGVRWIERVLRQLADNPHVDLLTTSEYLDREPPDQVVALPESSWGLGGGHWTWDNPDTHWMWEPIHEAEHRMERLVRSYPHAEDDLLAALNQAGRELLLLQSSDWPFLVTTGQAKEYATRRFRSHLQRFQQLADMLEGGASAISRDTVDEFYELDKVFPDIDYRWFEERQGEAS
ncbi:MAG: 1,4-alpha-glucan branching protein domain-containing protein [Chloroflexota bacterium]|nr:1,4-alpha-glucan branching protein domain-containing protein [Chloroflexota bacterium]